MRTLFVIGHPAHVHLFRNAIHGILGEGYEVMVGCIEKEITKELLLHYGIPHESIGPSQPDLLTKSLDVVRKDIRTIRLIREFEPDIVVSTGIPYAAHAARLSGIPSIAFSDTEIAMLVIKSMLPFVSVVCTPSCFSLDLGDKQVRYEGYHELAYLHPDYFEPDRTVLEEVGLEEGDSFFLLRLSSLDSSHDLGWRAVSPWRGGSVVRLARDLEKHGRVFIMSELPMSRSLEGYRLKLPPHRMLDLLAFAHLYIGEGATMASEAGVLGIPWIFVSMTHRGYLDDQEHNYDLGYRLQDAESVRQKAMELLQDPNLGKIWKTKRQRLLEEKIDVTRFIIDFVLGWPNSLEEARSERSG